MTLEEKLNARSLTNTYPEHYGKIIPYDDLIKIKDALEIFQQQASVEPVVKVQKAEIEQQENFMNTLKDIYNSGDMVEMQTKLEIYFENIDSCLLNKYGYDSSVSLLSV